MQNSLSQIYNTVKNDLIPSEDYIFGFADLHGLIDAQFDGFPYGISIGKKLDDTIVDKLEFGPTVEYFDYYMQINSELEALTKLLQKDLLAIGVNSILIDPTVSTGSKEYAKYLTTLTASISHKMVATRAGLGWIGKTDLFISKVFGPRLRLVSMLINQAPPFDSIPINESKCGKCSVCINICPAKAANGKLWNIYTLRDEFFDAHKCREKCGELTRQKLNIDERICGLCVFSCPIGRKKL